MAGVITIDFEVAKRRIEKVHEDKLILLDFTSMKDNGHFECLVCGCDWWGIAENVVYGTCGCPDCKKEESFRKKEIIAKQKLYETHRDSIVFLEYRGNRSKSTFHCNECGNEWDADTYTVLTGHGCSVCGHRRGVKKLIPQLIIPQEEIIAFVESYGCDFIGFVGNYSGNTTETEILFECGHRGIMTVQCFKQKMHKRICSSCATEKGNRTKSIPQETVISEIKNSGYEFIEFPNGYINGASLVSYRCSKGHISTRNIRYFRTHPTCGECEKGKMSLLQRGESLFVGKAEGQT